MTKYTTTRIISIDAAHRVSTHGSKCRNLHGHRYTIEAACLARKGQLHGAGEQTDMVLDFSFLKDEMMRLISEPCDHALIACLQDLDLLEMLAPEGVGFKDWLKTAEKAIGEDGFFLTRNARLGSQVYIVPFQPTAERLAEHWFSRLEPVVEEISAGVGRLVRVRVWETPNCYADYEVPNDNKPRKT